VPSLRGSARAYGRDADGTRRSRRTGSVLTPTEPVVPPQFDGESLEVPGAVVARRRLEVQRMRCRTVAGTSLIGAGSGVLFLCISGLEPAGVAIPVFFAVTSLLFAAASAALFARIAKLQLRDRGEESEDDDGGQGRGPDAPPDPPSGGNIEFDWHSFERDFRAYTRLHGARDGKPGA